MFSGLILKQVAASFPSNSFAFQVKTDNAGSSGSTEFTYPTISSGTYSCVVHWGDGTTDTITTYNDAAWTHTYSVAGTYNVYITGTITGISFAGTDDCLKFLRIFQWGTFKPGNAGEWFNGCENLIISATDIPVITGVTNMISAFQNCSSIVTIPNISSWNLTGVTLLATTFSGCTLFNQALSLTLPACTNIFGLFLNCTAFNSTVTLSTSASLTDMRAVFLGATSFNQSVNGFDVSHATMLDNFFFGATSFNQPVSGIQGGNWVPTAVTSMLGTFRFATAFNKKISWFVASVTTISNFLNGASSFNEDFTLGGMTLCTDISGLFQGATSYNKADLNSMFTTNVTNMSSLFQGATAYNQAISFDTSNCTDMSYMFYGATSFNSSVASMNVINVTNMDYMFASASAFNQTFSAWTPGSLNSADSMFDSITLTNANYNSILVAFDNYSNFSPVVLGGGNSHYDSTSGGFDGVTAHDDLVFGIGWTITDGGTP